MPIEPPNLDDRTFEDIVREAKSLIPRYAPEWTNHNDTDPGIALIHLFAWMNEAVLYRLNQVPERNYQKFLRLLGIEQRPPQPARVDLTFTPSSLTVPEVLVPRFAQVAVAGGGGDEPLVFEVDRSIAVIGAELDRVATFDGRRHVVEVDWPLRPFGSRPEPGAALVLGLASDAPFTSQVVELAVYVSERPGLVATGDDSRYPPPGRIEWEHWDAPRARWRTVDLLEDETRALTRSGRVRFRGPGARLVRSPLPDVTEERYWLRARLVSGELDRAPQLDLVAINTVVATQALTVHEEVLGTSDGSPHQTFRARHAPLVVAEVPERVGTIAVPSLQLDVIETSGPRVVTTTWTEVPDFDASSGEQPHFVVEHATGKVHFGDGRRGQIPRLGAQIVARRYRYGGGARGRVGTGAVSELLGAIAGIDSVTNLRPSWGGTDEEPLEDTKRKAARLLKAGDRAVTTEDFETLALSTPFFAVARARALALVHPGFPGVEVPGSVTVIVVPQIESDAPAPPEAMLRAVCAHLEDKRLLTTEVHVTGPTYRRLGIEVDVTADPRADLAQIEQRAEARLRTFLHPLTGGKSGEGWPFGGTLFFSDVYRELLADDDVIRVEQGKLWITIDGEDAGECRDVPIGKNELFVLSHLEVRPRYEDER